MKIISSISSWIIGRSALIFIGCAAYYIGLFTYGVALTVPMLLLGIVSPIVLIYFVSHPRIFIYFVVFYWPTADIINRFIRFTPGGSKYYSVNLLGVMLVIGVFFGIIVLLLERVDIFKYKLAVPMLLYLGMIGVGVLLNPMLFWGLRFLFRFSLPAVFYLVILTKINDFKEAKRFLMIAFAVFVLMMLFGFWLLLTSSPTSSMAMAGGEAVYRLGQGVAGFGFHPNSFGAIFPVSIMLTLFLYSDTQSLRNKGIYLFLIMSMMVTLFNTYSRRGWLALMTGMTAAGLLRHRKLYMMFLLTGAFLLVFLPSVTNLITSRWGERGAIEARYRNYELAWDLFLEKPLLGHGIGGFQRFTSAHMKAGSPKIYGLVGGYTPHNEYMRVLADQGIVGIFVYLFLMYRFLKLGVQIFKFPHPTAKNYGAFLISIIVIIITLAIPGHGMQTMGFYPWFFCAIGEVLLRELQSQKST